MLERAGNCYFTTMQLSRHLQATRKCFHQPTYSHDPIGWSPSNFRLCRSGSHASAAIHQGTIVMPSPTTERMALTTRRLQMFTRRSNARVLKLQRCIKSLLAFFSPTCTSPPERRLNYLMEIEGETQYSSIFESDIGDVRYMVHGLQFGRCFFRCWV
ncbi:uncharacterized protein M421DRAFT_374437 [Didymella exigua CBS 183.55]|uniref:Uncharacterized protein n=1 Tax=Didymella exigua CBS 183.55 TaxID=1150837 RepID=A0A6A5RPT2_9PLEO|nr:uncharacterized protein M421DRAFT_374437 [Didymella exigua CBS 183.55]KAF1930441.1 hypothetical protein M421DRAFT_374437 [Didymella exigua CBS 183.55]